MVPVPTPMWSYLGKTSHILEGNGKIVLTSIHGLQNARVGTISPDDEVNLHVLGDADRVALEVLLVLDGVLLLQGLVVSRNADGGDKALDGLGAMGDGMVTEELVQDLAMAHANVLIGLEEGGEDELHAAHLTIND